MFGHECPRVYTRPARELTPKTSAGFSAIRFADYLHRQLAGTQFAELAPPLLPWQKWFLIHALELNPDNSFRFKTVLLWVARQNGKTFLSALLILWRMYIDRDCIAIGVAQKLATAKKPYEQAMKIIAAIPRLKQELDRESRIGGELWFELTDGQRWWVDSAENGGRGLTFDLVFVDEILKHKTWAAWSALSKTTMARRRSQLIAASNTGDVTSIVQRDLHEKAMKTLEDPASRTGLFWWSPPDGMPLDTPEAWAYSNPSMGYTITEDAIRAAWSTDPAPVFRSEVGNLFIDASAGGPFQPGRWAAGTDRVSKRAPGGDVFLCIEVSHNRQLAHIGFAALRADGNVHVGIMASRPGTDWLVPWLTSPDRTFAPAGITFQTKGAPVSSMLGEFENAGLEVTEWGGPDLGRATGLLLDGVNLGSVFHREQPLLDVAAGSAVMKQLGDGYAIDRKNSPGDASPLSAVAGALWLLKNPPAKPVPRVRTVRRRSRG
ncbi:hypothetical protein H490_0103945 [Leucobacter sp. UCD-THU]|uniref:hypothetical protein n=1 Tax=Leucobacter sp. UCD-THU TaxID=1292023 RepID=UPI0003803EA8|nr:hypothetical protein [Leucobacter sp. UCD-THU]EYT56034.1 hypothetical protein H490_0103945 [Leucobacter sp. UCD-THU]